MIEYSRGTCPSVISARLATALGTLAQFAVLPVGAAGRSGVRGGFHPPRLFQKLKVVPPTLPRINILQPRGYSRSALALPKPFAPYSPRGESRITFHCGWSPSRFRASRRSLLAVARLNYQGINPLQMPVGSCNRRSRLALTLTLFGRLRDTNVQVRGTWVYRPVSR